MVLGDFNLPKLTWIDYEPSLIQDCACGPVYDSFTDILDDFNLIQMVTQPTLQDHVLDLFLTTNPTLVTDVTILPGLGNDDIVSAVIAVKPTQTKQKHWKIHLYGKADRTKFRPRMKEFQVSNKSWRQVSRPTVVRSHWELGKIHWWMYSFEGY